MSRTGGADWPELSRAGKVQPECGEADPHLPKRRAGRGEPHQHHGARQKVHSFNSFFSNSHSIHLALHPPPLLQMEPLAPTSILPAAHHISPVTLPPCDTNLFSFIFSNPFAKDSPYQRATPSSLRSHCLPGPVSVNHPVFADARGSTLSWGKLKTDALQVAATLRHGPLGLEVSTGKSRRENSIMAHPLLAPQPALLSTSRADVNRGSVVSPTVLIHLPNCLPFVTLAYGVLASGLTVSLPTFPPLKLERAPTPPFADIPTTSHTAHGSQPSSDSRRARTHPIPFPASRDHHHHHWARDRPSRCRAPPCFSWERGLLVWLRLCRRHGV